MRQKNHRLANKLNNLNITLSSDLSSFAIISSLLLKFNMTTAAFLPTLFFLRKKLYPLYLSFISNNKTLFLSPPIPLHTSVEPKVRDDQSLLETVVLSSVLGVASKTTMMERTSLCGW
jgi:hypothetical protein